MPDVGQMEKRQRVLADFGEFALRSDDLDAVLTEACRLVAEALGTGRAKVLEIEEEGRTLFVRAGVGWPRGVVGQVRLPMAERSSETYSIERGEPVITSDAAEESRFDLPTFMREAGVRALANVPVFLPGGKPFGLLQVDATEPRDFGQEDTQFLRTYATILGPVIDRLLKVQTLSATEQHYRSLFNSMDEAYAVVEVLKDHAGRWSDFLYLEVNPAFLEHTGLPDPVGQTATQLLGMPNPRWAEIYGRVADTGEPVRWEETELTLGRVFDLNAFRLGGDGSRRVAVLFTNVTQRKRAEAALRESEERQAFLLAFSDALRAEASAVAERAIRMLSEQMRLDRCYLATYRLEDDGADITHQVGNDSVPPLPETIRLSDFPEALRVVFDRTLVIEDVLGDQSLSPVDRQSILGLGMGALILSTLRRGAHRPLWSVVAVSAQPRCWTPGETALVEEVAERTWAAIEQARAEAALRESEEKYRTLFASINEGFCIVETVRDADGRVIDLIFREANEAYAHHAGYQPYPGLRTKEVTPNFEDEWLAYYDRVATMGVSETKEGFNADTQRWYRTQASRIGPEGSPFIGIVFEDVSERKRAEVALRESAERQAFLLMLSDRLRTEVDPRVVAEIAISLLADHMGLDRAYVAQVDKRRDVAEVGPEYRRPDLTSVPGVITLSDFPEAFAQVEATTLVLTDMAADPTLSDRDRAGFAAFRMGALIVASARKGTHNPVWALLVASEEPRRWTAAEVALVEETAERTWAALERARGEAALRESEGRLRALMEGIPQLVWRSCAEGRWTWSSPQWQAFTGQSQAESHGLGWLDALHPDDREATMRAWDAARPHGLLDAEYQVRRASDGAYLWHHTRSVPVRDDRGRIVEWLGTTTDVQAMKELQERQAVMVAELQHRTRNLIAVVRSIAGQTMAQTGPTEAFRAEFDHRLEALARVQGLLSRAEEEPVTIGALIRMELDALGALSGAGGRTILDGPEVRLRSSLVQTLALALHELATNARKHGALSRDRGRLSVTWRVREADGQGRRLDLEWRETGGEVSIGARPERRGYGRELIERALPYALGAKTAYELGPEGVRCTIDLPLERKERRSRRPR